MGVSAYFPPKKIRYFKGLIALKIYTFSDQTGKAILSNVTLTFSVRICLVPIYLFAIMSKMILKITWIV